MSVTHKTLKKPSLSIIVTVHAEGILLHKTLGSIRRAAALLDEQYITWELLIHVDNPTPNTQSYLDAHADILKPYRQFVNHFGDLGSSRNFAVGQAKGTYVTFIDADDLMSQRWLIDAYTFLESKPRGQYIAHTESTVEFGAGDSVIIKHGEINQATDTLLTVFSNRWNSIIMAPRSLLLEEPYTPNSPGYGYEDWHLNCRFIGRGLHNVLIPETVIFVRRKAGNSEWLRQKTNRLVLRKNPLFSFDNIRALAISGSVDTSEPTASAIVLPPTTAQRIKRKAAPLLRRMPPMAERVARKAYRTLRPVTAPAMQGQAATDERFPAWLLHEWRSMHSIEKLLFPSADLMATIPVYDSLTPEHYQTGEAFKKLIDHTKHNIYDYLLFVPWIKTGGADLLSVQFASTLQALRPDKHVLVIATLPTDSPWAAKLPPTVDFMPFGQITEGLATEVQYRLLEQIIENSGAQYLHILNSALAYDFITSHEAYISATQKKVIATSFSQSVDGTGRIFGYSHTHVPQVYELATLITTDNQAVATMWADEYGFDPKRIMVQHTPIKVPALTIPKRPVKKNKLNVLWIARLSPEKQPELVTKIAKLIKGQPIHIDMYGPADGAYGPAFQRSLPGNITYKGPRDGFFSVAVQEYDVLLYTSLFDGMPLTVLEAAGAELATVSSQVGGIPDFLGNNGILIDDIKNPRPYADALIDLLNDPVRLQKYGKESHKQLTERHSDAAYKKQLTDYCKRIGY